MPTSARVRAILPMLGLVLLALTALVTLGADATVARGLSATTPAPLWRDALGAIDRGTGWLVWKWLPTVIVVAVAALALALPPLRRYARGLALVALVHGATKLILLYAKPGLGRLRPSEWLAAGGDGSFFAGGVGFPSGHTGHYLSIALPLAVAWPRVGLPLLVVPAFASASRVVTNAHFVSDVLGSAALVVLLTWLGAVALKVGAPSRSLAGRA